MSKNNDIKMMLAKFIAVALCVGGLTSIVKCLTGFDWGLSTVIGVALDCLLNIRMSVSNLEER